MQPGASSSTFDPFDVIPATKQFPAYRYLATRCAILNSFSPMKTFIKNQLRAMGVVRIRWRKRVGRLKKAGWRYLTESKSNHIFLKRCTPPGYEVDESRVFCNKAHVCPFCWGRQHVLKPFRKFEKILFGASGPYKGPDNKLLPCLRPDLRIVRFAVRVSSPRTEGPLTPQQIPQHWEKVHGWLYRNRRFEVKAFQAEFASIMHRVYPDEKGGCLTVVRSGVMLVPVKFVAGGMAEYAASRERATVFDPLKKNLLLATAYGFRYPRAMMTAPAHLVATLLNCMRYKRLSTWYGRMPEPKTAFEES